jgi:hypothetical protein
MADSQDRQISIAGKGYTVRFGLRAILALKDEWGLAGEREVADRMGKVTLDDVHIVFWALLRTHHKDLTQEDALDLLDQAGIDGIQDILTQAIQAAAPRQKGGARPPARPAKAPAKTTPRRSR